MDRTLTGPSWPPPMFILMAFVLKGSKPIPCFAISPDMVVLSGPIRVNGEGLKTVGDFTVSAGQRLAFVLPLQIERPSLCQGVPCASMLVPQKPKFNSDKVLT